MLSTRFFSFLLFVVSFGLLAFASPIETTDLETRDLSKELVVRGGGYGSHPACGCAQDVIDILIDLKAVVDVQVPLLDGHAPPSGPCNAIIAAIKLALSLLVDVKINTPIADVDVQLIANLLAGIIVSSGNGLGLYGGLLVVLNLWLSLDLNLSNLVNSVCGLVPGVLALLGGLITGLGLTVNAVLHLVLTLVAALL